MTLDEYQKKVLEELRTRYARLHHRANTLVVGHLSNGVVEPWSYDAIQSFIAATLAGQLEVVRGMEDEIVALAKKYYPNDNESWTERHRQRFTKQRNRMSQHISKYLSRAPKRIDNDAWFYHEPQGIIVVHKGEQFIITWRQVEAAITDLEQARDRGGRHKAKAKSPSPSNKEK